MDNKNVNNTLLASLAVFRELYNSEKDVYGVIASFLTDLIKTQRLYSFNLNEIHHKFNTSFEFDIPRAVIKTSLGRLDFLEHTKTDYIVKDISNVNDEDFDKKQNQIISKNERIIDKLYSFIEKEKETILKEKEKETILHNFCNFLIDESNGNEYLEYIASFVIENEDKEEFKSQLNLIREGVILYSGIKFNNNINDIGSWRTELTIYLETEILFHIAGYNGELYQTLVLDLLELLKEVNQKAKKKLIRLKYFKETRDEIEDFFTKAKYLLKGNEKPNPDVTAMVSILKGCSSVSDIMDKKSDFYTLLKGKGIIEDEYDKYFEPYNHKYNIIDTEITESVSEEIGKDATNYLRLLNFISIHRKESKISNFDNIGFILLSGNAVTLKVAWNDLLKDTGNVPLATHLSFLTNKFWFKLNKGFGKNSLPKSFDIITKAQISLSKLLNDTVGEKYTELQNEFKNGNLSEEQAKARVVNLRNQVRNPEEIKEDTVKDVLSILTEDSLEKFVEEQEHFKIKAEKQVKENIELKESITEKDAVIEKTIKQQKILNDKLINTKEELLKEKLKFKETLEKQKEPLDKIAKRKYRNVKFFIASFIVFYYSLLVGAIFSFGWDKMEKYTFIVGLVPVVFSGLYLLFFEKNINPIKFLAKISENYFNKIYTEFAFEIEKLNKTNNEIRELRLEIEKLNASS